MSDMMYRYEDVIYADSINENGEYRVPGRVCVEFRQYFVIRRTAKGVWIGTTTWERFILNNSRKRFAHETEALALESFRARKRIQIQIHEAAIKRAREALELVTGRSCEYRQTCGR